MASHQGIDAHICADALSLRLSVSVAHPEVASNVIIIA
jgi:hypothetical protein